MVVFKGNYFCWLLFEWLVEVETQEWIFFFSFSFSIFGMNPCLKNLFIFIEHYLIKHSHPSRELKMQNSSHCLQKMYKTHSTFHIWEWKNFTSYYSLIYSKMCGLRSGWDLFFFFFFGTHISIGKLVSCTKIYRLKKKKIND